MKTGTTQSCEGGADMVDFADVVKKSMAAGIGVLAFTADKAHEFVNDMVERGEMTREQGMSVTKEIVERGEAAREQLREIIKTEVRKVIDEVRIAGKDDLKRVEDKIDRLLLVVEHKEEESQ
jgi:polyhydroxyalkanoate synthesis regulator phasin